MRLDRLITLNLVQPARRTLQALDLRPSSLDHISILMYHSISEDNEPVAPYYVTNTRPDTFRAQMHFLAKHNFRVTDLETGLREPRQDSRTVVITFDDGFRDFYTNAFPILREFGFTATMFLPTGLISVASALRAETGLKSVASTLRAETGLKGVASALCAETLPRPSKGRGTKGEGHSPSPRGLELRGEQRKEFARGEGSPELKNRAGSESLGRGEESPRSPLWGEGRGEVSLSTSSQPRHTFKGRDCMTWDEVRTLAAEGIHFGSHTVSHPKLYDLDWPQIESELALSKETLEHELGCEIATFAYPFAYPQADREFTRRFETLLQKTGYRCNVTTRVGRAKPGDDPFSLRRLPMNSFDDTTLLQAKLEGSYDWLARPQAIAKKVKRWL